MKKHMKIGAASGIDMLNAFKTRLAELDPNAVEGATQITAGEECPNCGSKDCDGSCQKVEGASEFDTLIDEQYIDDLMSNVADQTVGEPWNAVCSWETQDDQVIFTLASFDNDSLMEYTCPFSDLTGDISADIDYIIESIS